MKTQFEIWLENVNSILSIEWESQFTHRGWEPIVATKGNKFVRLMHGSSVWAFVSMKEGEHKGLPLKKGDLMKPASLSTPAKHSRGNIFDGTAKYSMYGPNYL